MAGMGGGMMGGGGGGGMGGGGGGGMNPAQGWGMLLGALSGIKQHFMVDKPRYDSRLKYEAETQKYSPWTGMQGKFVAQPYLLETMHQGAIGGGEFGKGFDRGGSDSEERTQSAPMDFGGGGGSGYGGSAYGSQGPSLGTDMDFSGFGKYKRPGSTYQWG